MPYTDDASEFFAEDDFAEVVTIAGASVRAIFDSTYARAGGIVASSDPALWVPSAYVSTVVRGAAVVVRGVAYTVRDIEADGTGVTVLQLERS
jgi:hypothetical protein